MKTISDTDIMPSKLISVFNSLNYEEEGGLSVHTINYLDNELHFDFSLYMRKIRPLSDEYWRLKVLNHRDSKIDIDNLGSFFSFYSDHFLLKEFNDTSTDLYIKKPGTDPESIFTRIYEIHHSQFENLFSLERFIYSTSLLGRCKINNGVFARGPKYILDYYYKELEKAGKEPYYFGEYVAKKWNGNELVPYDNRFKLALLGGTYFVGQDFEFVSLK